MCPRVRRAHQTECCDTPSKNPHGPSLRAGGRGGLGRAGWPQESADPSGEAANKVRARLRRSARCADKGTFAHTRGAIRGANAQPKADKSADVVPGMCVRANFELADGMRTAASD